MTAVGGVVYVAPEWPSPAHSGGRQRIAAIAHAIESTGTPFTLLAPDHEAAWPAWSAAGVAIRRRRRSVPVRILDVAAALGGGEHVMLRRARTAGLVDAFHDVLQQLRPRVTILGRPFFGQFVDAARSAGSRVIGELDETLSGVARSALRSGGPSARWRAALELGALERFERRELPRMDEVWVSSSVELRNVRRIAPQVPIRIVPNVSPQPLRAEGPSTPGPVHGMAFVGWYGYPPNERAAMSLMDDILPMVDHLGGPARLWLIGRDPTQRMLRRARGRSEVTITGQVPDVRPFLAQAGLLVCPIRSGGGTRVKIIEAMALDVPVISTPLGVEGLDLVPGRDAHIAESNRGLAEAVVRLAGDPDEVARVTTAARQVVAAHHAPEALLAAIRAALEARAATSTGPVA
jgi:glycosyltransferase involved in cell wall biosynthesis